jgi:uncharacterized protein (TIGR00255 family)
MHSMTGFANATLLLTRGQYSLEMRALNHRYLDLSFNLPEPYRKLESEMREYVRAHCHRGKIDISLKIQAQSPNNSLNFNQAFLTQLKEATTYINKIWQQQQPVSPLEALSFPGVMQPLQNDDDDLPRLKEFFQQTFTALLSQRAQEGQHLQTHLAGLAMKFQILITEIIAQQSSAMQRLREKLVLRVQDLIAACDPLRLEQELALLSTRFDIEEELSRLSSHIQHFLQLTTKDSPVGKQMDFLLQELTREINTLGSKTQDLPITYQALAGKLLVEQMREQVQNVE